MPIDPDSTKTAKGPKKNIFIYIFVFIDVFIKLSTFILCVMIPLFFFPFTDIAAKKPVHLTSQRLEYHIPTKKVFVQGDVTLAEEGFRLHADNMELDLASGEGMANGDIRIYLPQGHRMDTDMAEFNINTGWWRIDTADMRLEPSGYIHFEEAEKTDPNTINMIRPRFTSCPGKNPPWEIRGKRGTMKVDKSLKISSLSMRIKGIPVFYLPVAYVPIWDTGSTGMQPPEAGHSSRHGYFIKNRFTWPFTRHIEGRLFLDFYTETGIGLGTGWKYSPETDSQGSEAKFYLLRENSPEKIHGKMDLSADIGRSDKKRGVVDVHYTTERDFDRRFSSDLNLRDLSIGESRAFVTLQRSVFGIMGEWEHRRSLMDPNDSDVQDSHKSDVHLLPGIASHLQPTPLLRTAKTQYSPLFGLRLSAIHMDWELPAENAEGEGNGERYTIEPGLSFQVPVNYWFNLNSLFSTRQSFYQPVQSEKEGWSRTYMVKLILTGPRTYKDYMKTYKDYKGNSFTIKEANRGVRHLAYPQVSFEYETHNGIQPPSIMDLEGDVNEMKNIRFLIINRIWGKSPKHEIPVQQTMDLIISQTLQLKGDRQAFEIRINTVLDSLVRFNGRGIFFTEGRHGRKDLDLDFSFGNSDKGEISIGWRHLWDEINEDHNEGINQYAYNEKLNTTRLFVTSPLWKGYQLSTSFIYDYKTKNRIEETYSVFYKHACWKARIGYIKHIDEDMIRVDLNLIF